MPKTDQFVRDFAEKARTNLDLVGLRRWAHDLQAPEPKPRAISYDEIPKDIRDLEAPLNPFCKLEMVSDIAIPILWVEWGGGFGHWGLALTTNAVALETKRIRIEIVTTDVYGFITTDQ